MNRVKDACSRRAARDVPHLVAAFRHSLEGLLAAIRHERAFRQELLLGLIHVPAAACCDMPLACRALLLFSWFLLLAAELLNSALEAVVDLVSPEWHALAKRAKDCGSAAVLCLLAGMALLWIVVLCGEGR